MDKKKQNTVPVGIQFMGRSLGELLELKAKCRRRLSFLDKNKTQISAYVYEKLRQEYQSYLSAVDGEVAVRLCDYEVKLAEIRVISNQLEQLKKSFSDNIQEIKLRYSLGEYDQQGFERLIREYKDRMQHFDQGIVKYGGEQERIRQFLDQVYGNGSTRLERMSPEMGRLEPETAVPVKEPEPQVQEVPAGAPAVSEEVPSAAPQPPPVVSPEKAGAERISEPEEAPLPEPEQAAQFQPAADTPGDLEKEQPATNLLETLEKERSFEPHQPGLATEEHETRIDEPADAGLEEEMDLAGFALAGEEEADKAENEPVTETNSRQSATEDAVEELPGLQEIAAEEPQQAAVEDQAVSEPAAEEAGDTERSGEQAVEQARPCLEEGTPDVFEEIMLSAGEAERVGESEGRADLTESVESSEPQAAEARAGSGGAADLADLFESTEPAEQPPPSTGGALDLDAIMSAAGVSSESEPASAPAGELPGEEEHSEERSTDSLMEEAPEAPEQAVEKEEEPLPEDVAGREDPAVRIEPDEAEPAARHGDEDRAASAAGESPEPPEKEQPAEAGGEIAAAMPVEDPGRTQARIEVPASGEGRALSLDEKLEISLDVDRMDGDSQALSINETIDAIKKKTVKCPSCGTMNYAIRWYCENCEATLTAL